MSHFTGKTDFAPGQVKSSDLNNITQNLRLSGDSVDATTITVSGGGVLSVGVLGASNLGANSVTTNSILDANVTGPKIANDAIDSQHYAAGSIDEEHYSDGSVSWAKTKSADRATQADIQSEAADHFVSPAVLKYHPGISKAGGVLTMATGAFAGGYNVSGTATGTATSRTVTLGVTMANTNYRVQFSNEDSGTLGNTPVITAKTTTTFTVNSGATKVAFDVFGTLA